MVLGHALPTLWNERAPACVVSRARSIDGWLAASIDSIYNGLLSVHSSSLGVARLMTPRVRFDAPTWSAKRRRHSQIAKTADESAWVNVLRPGFHTI